MTEQKRGNVIDVAMYADKAPVVCVHSSQDVVQIRLPKAKVKVLIVGPLAAVRSSKCFSSNIPFFHNPRKVSFEKTLPNPGANHVVVDHVAVLF
jgi:hypothetical protein